MNSISPDSLLDFSGKTVLVTGSSRGIGAAIATRFAEAGASVAVHYHSNLAGAQATAENIRRMQRPVEVFQGNLGDPVSVNAVMDGVLNYFSRLDILINNAGIYPVTPLLEISMEEWRRVLDANLNGYFFCIQAASLRMIRQGYGGAVVNISSIEGDHPAFGHGHYCAAKAGVNMLTRQAAYELGKENIRVNAVAPGLIWKEGLEEYWPAGVSSWLERVPLQRLGRGEDIANACLFLSSPGAAWITGATLLVDGGIMTTPIF